jgi:hypothetical protein
MGTDDGITGRPCSACYYCYPRHDGNNAKLRFWASKEQAQQRYNICIDCEQLTKIKTCKSCGCFVIGKTKLANEICPLNKW